MLRTARDEAVDLIDRLCALLNALPVSSTTLAAANLRRETGALSADAETLLRSAALPGRIAACFDFARAAGATFAGFHALRAEIVATPTQGAHARIVQQDVSRRAIVGMARCLAATDFQSREAVLGAQARMNAAFDAAEEEAADALDTDTYRALVTLHASVTQDLSRRARPLPRIVTYAVGAPVPALVLAQRLYGDAARAPDLVGENAVRAPLFMPLAGRALSA